GPIDLARRYGKGVFVLAATSNIEAYPPQSSILATGAQHGLTVAAGIVAEVDELNQGRDLGSVGVVIGATVNFSDYGIEPALFAATPILAPGFGEQGALVSDIAALYGDAAANV